MAALDDLPRPGRKPTITAEAKAWVVNLACRKAKELGYPHELWTTRLLAAHVREHGPREGHGCLGKLAQGTLCIILNEQEIKPHKVRYYLERRDPDFKAKMVEVVCVYVCPVKTGVFSRSEPCRGRSQSPVVRMAGRRETNNPEAHRQGLPWGGYKSPGRNKSKRVVASKTARSESRAFIDKAK